MAGFTSHTYRKFMAPLVLVFYTEMVSDAGYLYNNKRQQSIYRYDVPLTTDIWWKEQLIKAVEKLKAVIINTIF